MSLYTVPSRLIGRQLELRLYHDRMTGYIGNQLVVELPRVRSSSKSKRRARCINYRHVIEGLRRKPRAFLYCTWRDDLLPNDHYRRLWQQIKECFERDSAAVLIVEALYIAATQDKALAVAAYLDEQLTAGRLTLVGLRRHFQLLTGTQMPTVSVKTLATFLPMTNSLAQSDLSHPSKNQMTATQTVPASPYQSLSGHLKKLRLSHMLSHWEDLQHQAMQEQWVLRPVLASTLRIGGGEKMATLAEADFERSALPWLQDAIKLRLVSYP